MTKFLLIIISAVLVNNIVLTQFLGICPFLGVSSHIESAIGMGFAVIFVMTLASAASWIIQYFLLIPFHIEFLQTVSFILIIASLVQLVEFVIKKVSPTLKQALGIYLPLITTNCAILGVAILNTRTNLNFVQSIFSGLGYGIGFTLALLLMAGIRERLNLAPIPSPLKGIPVTFLVASLLSVAFLGFIGLIPK